MKSYRIKQTDGVEVTATDFDKVASIAARAMDNVCSELFRLPPNEGGSTPKGVIPYNIFGSNGSEPQSAGIVTSSGTTDRSVLIYPFRALVASVTSSPEDAWENVQTVDVVPGSAGFLYSTLQLDATSSDKRIDLIYAKVTVSSAVQTDIRYVRDPITGVVSQDTLSVELSNTFSLLIKKGTGTGGTPARPTIPADDPGNGIYNIPLAYVFLPTTFGASGQVNNVLIQEVAPVLPMARATGVTTIRPANALNKVTSDWSSQEDFSTTGRPSTYLPTTMAGGETLLISANWQGTGHTPALNGVRVVDDSVDWRRRMFKWTATAQSTLGTLPWNGGGPIASDGVENGFGQSFWDDGTGALGTAGGVVALNLGAVIMSNAVHLFVDLTTGALKMKIPAGSPGSTLFVWLEATGQFANAS